MIERSYTIGTFLLFFSVAAHASSLAFAWETETAQIAGLEAKSVLMLGNSFQDLAVGVAKENLPSETASE